MTIKLKQKLLSNRAQTFMLRSEKVPEIFFVQVTDFSKTKFQTAVNTAGVIETNLMQAKYY